MTGTPSIKRAYNLGLKAVPNFETLSDEVIAYYEQHLDQIPYALARGFVIAEMPGSVRVLSVIATTQLDEAAGKATSDCFTGLRYAYRDSDFDRWLGKKQPPAAACAISTLGFTKGWTFAEAAAKVLGLGAGTNVKALGNALIENGHTMTLAQVESMVETTGRGDTTGMRTDGYGNFFFVETKHKDEPVSVAFVLRDDSRWYANVNRLGNDDRWNADNRLLVRNLDASKLGS